MEKNNPSSSKPDRKIIEKNRRNNMKALCSKLSSLLPPDSERQEVIFLQDQLKEATDYIENLKAKVESIKQKKESLVGKERKRSAASGIMPKIEIEETGSALKIVIVTGLDSQFMFNETIRILHEDGAEVLSATYSANGDYVFHTIHAKMAEPCSSNGAARLSERLKNLFEC